MACPNVTRNIIPAPTVGDPRVLNLEINRDMCEIHLNGMVEGCFATEYRQAFCCGDEDRGFEVPILGYNTTPTTYAKCSGGLVPNLNTPSNYTPPYHSTQTLGVLPPKETMSSGNKKRVGLILLVSVMIISLA